MDGGGVRGGLQEPSASTRYRCVYGIGRCIEESKLYAQASTAEGSGANGDIAKVH